MSPIPEKASKAQDGIFGVARNLVEHDVIHTAELLTACVVDAGAVHLARRDEPAARVTRIFNAGHDTSPGLISPKLGNGETPDASAPALPMDREKRIGAVEVSAGETLNG